MIYGKIYKNFTGEKIIQENELIISPSAEKNMFLPMDATHVIMNIVRFHFHDYGSVSELFYNTTLLFILGLKVFA